MNPLVLPSAVRARLHAILTEADPTIRPVKRKDARMAIKWQRKRYQGDRPPLGTMFTQQDLEACRDAVRRLELLAETEPRRISLLPIDGSQPTIRSAFFVDVEHPDQLLFAPN